MQSGDPPDVFQAGAAERAGGVRQCRSLWDVTSALQQNGWEIHVPVGTLVALQSRRQRLRKVPWEAGMVGFWYNKAPLLAGRYYCTAYYMDSIPGRCRRS